MTQKQATSHKSHKYYLLNGSYNARPQGWQLTNEAELAEGPGRRGTLRPPGTHQRGFRQYPVAPHFHLPKQPRQKLYDFEWVGSYWLISDQAKELLTQIAPHDSAFLRCTTDVAPGLEPRNLWLFDVITVLDAVDLERSSGRLITSPTYKPHYQVAAGNKIIFNPQIVGDHHLFRMDTTHTRIVCDEYTKRQIKASGLTGIGFDDPEKL